MPDDTLYTIVNQTQTVVTVNGVDAACSTNCSYITTSAATPKINSFSVTGNTLTFSISGSKVTTTSTLVVNYAGSPCTNVITTTLTAVKCTIPTDSNNNIIVEGGPQIP